MSFYSIYREILKNRVLVISFSFTTLLIFCAFLAPLISPYDVSEQNLILGAAPPSLANFFGTDVLGRDLLSRVLYGSRVSLLVGFLATFVAITIGLFYGALSGYFGGKIDTFMMRVVDILDGLPFVIFIILILVIFGRDIYFLFISIGAFGWLSMARIVRLQVLGLRKKEFIISAQIMGASTIRILYKHIIPNVFGTVIVYATLLVPQFMLLEAFLSFLGLGVQPPDSSWGILIREGATTMEEYWWLLIFPALLFSITLFVLNFLGDGLRDILDPRNTQQLEN